MSDTARIDLERHACGPCQRDEHYQCRDGEWGGCPCPHARGIQSPPSEPAPSAATAHPSAAEGPAPLDLSVLAPAPAAPANQPAPPADAVAAAGGGAGEAAQAVASPAASPAAVSATATALGSDEAVAGVAVFPRPDWWGEKGCRRADEPGHTCLDVWGHAPADSHRPCVAEQRAAMAETFERYRAVG